MSLGSEVGLASLEEEVFAGVAAFFPLVLGAVSGVASFWLPTLAVDTAGLLAGLESCWGEDVALPALAAGLVVVESLLFFAGVALVCPVEVLGLDLLAFCAGFWFFPEGAGLGLTGLFFCSASA